MRRALLSAALSLGLALAQTATPSTSTSTDPASTDPASTDSTGVSSTSVTPSAATSAVSTPAGSVTLSFAPQPGTTLRYALTLQSQVRLQAASVTALPGKTLSAQQERARKRADADIRAALGKNLPSIPAIKGSLTLTVLPHLADGSQVIELSEAIQTPAVRGAAARTITLKLRQVVHPDGTSTSTLQDASDPALRQLGQSVNSLLGQVGSSFAGSPASLFGRPLTPGQRLTRSDTVDLGQYLGSLLQSAGAGAQASGRLTAASTTTYLGQDAQGRAVINQAARFADSQLQISVPRSGPMTFKVQGLQVDGQSLLRPDGLLAGSRSHTVGSITLSVQEPSQPYQSNITLHLDQTVALQPQ